MKFCQLAQTITNCTENCKVCLEEEAKTREIEIGDKVRYITEDPEDIKESGFYPPKGTIGVVIGIEDLDYPASYLTSYLIRWPEGITQDDGCWYVGIGDIELAEKFE